MTRDEHKNIVNQLLSMTTPEQQAAASALLVQLTDDYETVMTEYETAQTNADELARNNETLRDVNAKLFLRVGEPSKTQVNQQPTNDDERPSFDSLFNEKGELI